MKNRIEIYKSDMHSRPHLRWDVFRGHQLFIPEVYGYADTPEACILAANKLGYNFAVPGEDLPPIPQQRPAQGFEGYEDDLPAWKALDMVAEKLKEIEALALKLQASVQAKDNLIAQLEADITTKDRMLRECKRAIGYHFNPLVNRDLAHNNLMTVIHDLRYY